MSPRAQIQPAERRRLIVGALVLAGLTFLAYSPALNGGFISDDDNSLTANPLIASADGLHSLWLTTQPHDYWPLNYTTLWVEWRIWGMHSAGYHVTNVFLHVVAALLLWRLVRRMGIPGAFLAALFFALHPVNVESVAWITQRKNLVAMLFFLLSILCFVETDPGAPPGPAFRPGLGRWYWLSLLAFAFAMLGKGSVAPLPLVLLGIIGWHRRLKAWDLIRMAPFFAVSALFTGVNVWFQAHIYTQIRTAGFTERVLGAAAVLWFYLGKAIWPTGLSFIYPLWSIRVGDICWWIPLVAALGTTAALCVLGKRGGAPLRRGALFAWLYFCVMLSPVMGFTDVAFMKSSLVADHYQHLALIGVTTLAAASLVSWIDRLRPAARRAGWALCILLVGLLGLLTLRQSRTFRNMQALYTNTVERNPGSWMAHVYLADILATIPGRQAEAIAHYDEALRINPDVTEAHNNLGLALAKIPGRQAEAISQYEEALQINPNYAKAHNNLAIELAKLPGRQAEAIAHYEKALQIDPDYANAHNNLAVELAKIPGRLDEAIGHYREALRLDPHSVETRENLARELAKATGGHDEAIALYEEVLQSTPNSAEAHFNLAVELGKNPDRRAEAIAHYREVLRINPNSVEAHFNLAVELGKVPGRQDESIAHYRETLRINPNYAEAHDGLALELSAIPGRQDEAIAHYEEALRINPKSAETHNNLAIELVKIPGRLDDAIGHYEEALRLNPRDATAQNNIAVAYANEGHIDEAIAHLELALKLDPTLPDARDNLEKLQAARRQ